MLSYQACADIPACCPNNYVTVVMAEIFFFCQQHSAPILQSTFCSAIACNLGEAVADSKGFCRPLFIQDGRKTSAKMRQKMTEGKVILRSTKSRTNLMKKRIWSHYIQHCSFTAGQH